MKTKKAVLVGIGMGNPLNLTLEARLAIENAVVVAGAERILNSVKEFISCETFDSYDSVAIFQKFESVGKNCVAVFSGDTGFYSGAKKLYDVLVESGWDVKVIPGITSAQYFASKLGKSWQNWNLVSAHGADCDIGAEISFSRETFFLTGGKVTVRTILDFLEERKFNGTVHIGANLSYLQDEGECSDFSDRSEKIIHLKIKDGFYENYDKDNFYEIFSEVSLAVVLVENENFESGGRFYCAIPDELFVRNNDSQNEKKVPMTKQFVRSAIVSMIQPENGEIIWDVGAGTGAVSIDLARSCKCSVFAVEEKAPAVELEKLNRSRFCSYNLEIIFGRAPDALSGLPSPDAVFIGGSEGELASILDLIISRKKVVRIVVSAVTVETISECERIAVQKNLQYEVVQLSISKSKKIGKFHLMQAENPIWLVKITCC